MAKVNDNSRDLLFGLLALQNGLIGQGDLFAAFAAWTRNKGRPLADHLVELGHLDAARRSLVEAIADLHIQASGGDSDKSLAALSVGRATCNSLARAGGPELAATIGHVGSAHGSTHEDEDHDQTSDFSVGSATSGGQRFRILRPHAKGGLGAVFVALDAELNREVALKQIVDDRADEPTSRFRFVVEAQITGGLEHPGIVPVYGLGAYGDGRPYYAMRFIRGDSLKEAIDLFHRDMNGGTRQVSQPAHPGGSRVSREQNVGEGRAADTVHAPAASRDLAIRKLLRRFLDVCNAIEYAHSRGVIHRDIKPANIIVGKHGETLVVDWGLAKPTGRALPESESAEQLLIPSFASGSSETLPGSALGTPAYMSPEQAEGQLDRMGPRSDVYSLGATLYCLLTGQPPIEGDVADVIRAVQRGDFRPPRQVDASVDQAIEAICLKAMALRPEDRYPSSRALADDLDRWLADEPVLAWQEPIARRARRWARRDRTAVTGVAAALVAGVVGLAAVLAVQTRANGALAASLTRETSARSALAASNADLSRSQAAVQARYNLAVEAIKTFHTGVSEDFLLKQEQFKEARDRLLKSASDFYGRLGALLGKETDPTSSQALWQANYELAELTGQVGKLEDALAAHRQVLAARSALAAEAPVDSTIKADVGRSLTAVAGLLGATGKADEAETTYRRAESLLVELTKLGVNAGAARVVLANCRSNLGALLFTAGRIDEALSVYRESRADLETMVAARGATAEARLNLAETIIKVALLLAATGKSADAEVDYRKSQSLLQALADSNPTYPGFRSALAASHNNLGNLLAGRGRSPEAEDEYRAAIAIHQKLADQDPAVNQFRGDVATDHHNLGFLLLNSGKPIESGTELRKALALRQKLAEDNPSVARLQRNLADSLGTIGWQLARSGKLDEAIDFYTRDEAIREKLVEGQPATPADIDGLANCRTNMVDALRRLGRVGEALAACNRSLAVREPLVAAHRNVPGYRARLGETYLRLGQVRYDLKDLSGAAAAWKTACKHYDAIKFRGGSQRFLLACCHSSLAGVGGTPGSGVSTAEGGDHAERALAILRQEITLGFRNRDTYRTEAALASLRNRPDYQVLMMDLEFPASPFAP